MRSGIRESAEPPIVVLMLRGEVELLTAKDAFAPLLERIEAAEAPPDPATRPSARFLLDASGVTFMDSSGLANLIGLNHRCRQAGGMLVVVPGPLVQRLLDRAQLSQWLTIARDRAHARSLLLTPIPTNPSPV